MHKLVVYMPKTKTDTREPTDRWVPSSLFINPNRHGLSNSTYDMGGGVDSTPPNISESRHHSTTKISQNNLLHVNLPFCIKNALYFMPTA